MPGKVREHKKHFGGRQEGAGRPKGSLSRRAKSLRKVTDRHIRGKRLPLDVMIENMIHFQDEARHLQDQMADVLLEFNRQFSEEGMKEILTLLSQCGDSRMKAQKCAADSAPFIHPKLSAIAVSASPPNHPRDIRDDSPDDNFAEEFRRLRSQPYIPPTIEGEAEVISEVVRAEADEDEDA